MVRLLVQVIRLYRLIISPFLGQICRFHPSCSRYAEGCLLTHGLFLGTWLTLKRLGRCHPFHPGGPDPVPPKGFRTSSTPTSCKARRPDSGDSKDTRQDTQHEGQPPQKFSASPLAFEATSLSGQS